VHLQSSRRTGTSLTDVIVLTLVVVLCSAALLPAAIKEGEKQNRIQCAAHLKMIGNAIILYANENKGLFPRTKADRNDDKLRFFTVPNIAKLNDPNAKMVDPFGTDHTPEANDITAALYLLLRTEGLEPQNFLCPTVHGEIAVRAAPDKPFQLPGDPVYDFTKQTNFPSARYLDYSFVNVYPSADAISKGHSTFATTFPNDFAVAADINPGGDLTKISPNAPADRMRDANSPNHGRDGQNVLYSDAHVEFQTTPYCSTDKDNIYTYGPADNASGGLGIVGSPVDAKDTVLLPVAEQAATTQPGKQ